MTNPTIKDFNLSEKIERRFIKAGAEHQEWIRKNDIKEFIRLLKEFMRKRIDFLTEFDGLNEVMLQIAEVNNILDNLDKLAGNKLT